MESENEINMEDRQTEIKSVLADIIQVSLLSLNSSPDLPFRVCDLINLLCSFRQFVLGSLLLET